MKPLPQIVRHRADYSLSKLQGRTVACLTERNRGDTDEVKKKEWSIGGALYK
jgi:hypothetical protein